MMYTRKVLFFWLLTTHILFANHKTNNVIEKSEALDWMCKSKYALSFTENKGQMADMQGKPVDQLLFKVSSKNLDIYIAEWGISYVFFKIEEEKKEKITDSEWEEERFEIEYSRTDMELVGASIKKENIIKEYASADYSNYYLAHCLDGVREVRSYKRISISNVYPGIDWILYSNNGSLKYDFIVHPGADPKQIKMRYHWAKDIQKKEDGGIMLSTSMGSITEGIPVSYQDENQLEVKTGYNILSPLNVTEEGTITEIGFDITAYDLNKILVIDPSLDWATYYGGTDADGPKSISVDGIHVWVAGYTISTVGFPTQNPGGGAYFNGSNAGGSSDAFILKFDTAGVQKWATYYGGTGTDAINAIHSDGKYVWITGETSSPVIPILNPGGGAYYQAAPGGGGTTGFIIKVNIAGVPKWATYFGGNVAEKCHSIHSDGINVWVTGETQSNIFPNLDPLNGAYFQGALNGIRDGFVAKFDTFGIQKWTTYYGGDGAVDYCYDIHSDSKNVWVTGLTNSTNFPTDSVPGSYFQGTRKGPEDAFILKFDTSGVSKWATYYGGTLNEQGHSIHSDGVNVWVTGSTTSGDLFTKDPGNGAYFQVGNGGTSDAFILKFDTSGVSKWATYYGGTVTEVSTQQKGAYITAYNENIWVVGNSSSTDCPITDPLDCSTYYNTNAGGQDIFILQFDTTGVRKYSTYYGGTGSDWATGVSIDPNTECAFITGEWVGTSTDNPTVDAGGGAYYQDSLAGGTLDDGFIMKFCPILNTLMTNMSSTDATCNGINDGTATVLASGGTPPYSYSWNNGDSVASIDSLNPATYVVIVTDSCAQTITDSAMVTSSIPFIVAISSKIDVLCNGDSNGQAVVSASGGTVPYTFSWSTGGTDSIEANLGGGNYSVTVTDSNGCFDSVSTTILEPDSLIVITSGVDETCTGDNNGQVAASASGGTTPYSYLWSTGSTDTMINGLSGGSYMVNVVDSNNCSDSANVLITTTNNIDSCDTIPAFSVYVPNSFTPDGDGYNDFFSVKLSGVIEMQLLVYDRLGTIIYETTNQSFSWDGKYNGSLLYSGVYIYQLQMTLLNGQVYSRKGNVTLLE